MMKDEKENTFELECHWDTLLEDLYECEEFDCEFF